LVKSLLASDVKLLDAQGRYAPQPKPATPDSFSVGIGFVGVPATITP
jgi:hypothetical protein